MKQRTILTAFILFVLLSATSIMAANDAEEEKMEFKNQTLCPVITIK